MRFFEESSFLILEIMWEKMIKAVAQSDKTPLRFWEVEIPCYVLEDWTRVLSWRWIQNSLGIESNKSWNTLTNFLLRNINNNNSIVERLQNPLKFERKWAWWSAEWTNGYDATLLIDICDWLIQANKDGKMPDTHTYLVDHAEIIIRSVAKVGIIALVDEATGYQKRKDEYQATLQTYIAKEMRPWLKTFKDEYYKELYKLLGWDWYSYVASKKNHPQVIGKITNQLVYNKLPNGVIQELEKLNPRDDKWVRKNRHHQFLTESVWYRHLIEHLAKITAISSMYWVWDYKRFKAHFDTLIPDERDDWQLALEIPFSVDEYIGNQNYETT